jgi:hypothetical protein
LQVRHQLGIGTKPEAELVGERMDRDPERMALADLSDPK